RSPLSRAAVLISLLPASICGCGSNEIDPAAVAIMKGIGGLYFEYAFTHKNVGPPDVDKLKAHARSMDPRTAGGAGVDLTRLDDYFVSPRDKQPLVILFN